MLDGARPTSPLGFLWDPSPVVYRPRIIKRRLRSAMGTRRRQGRQRGAEMFNCRKMVDQIDDLYSRLLP